jgi:hypothetical protein
MDETEEISGTLDYPSAVTSTIQEDNGDISLLIIDKPPLGHFNSEDIAEAHSFFRDFLQRPAGSHITVLGIRGTLLDQPVILVIRAA